VYDIVKKRTFAISSSDEFLCMCARVCHTGRGAGSNQLWRQWWPGRRDGSSTVSGLHLVQSTLSASERGTGDAVSWVHHSTLRTAQWGLSVWPHSTAGTVSLHYHDMTWHDMTLRTAQWGLPVWPHSTAGSVSLHYQHRQLLIDMTTPLTDVINLHTGGAYSLHFPLTSPICLPSPRVWSP